MSVMLSKVLRESLTAGSPNGRTLVHWCPGCNHAHFFPIEKKQENGAGPWRWNGDAVNPTFDPSMHISHAEYVDADGDWHPYQSICHYNLVNGMIQFLEDCRHSMAGKVLPIPEWPTGRRP